MKEDDKVDYEEISEDFFQILRNNSKTSLTNMLNEFNKGEIGVLNYLVFDNDNVTAGELSEKLNVTTARIANVLNSLEYKGYIKRNKDLYDKRKILVSVTSKGKSLANDVKNDIKNKIIMVIKEIGYDDIKTYINIAQKIKKVLK